MCCFTGPVISVTTTRIFARARDNERQFVVYSMRLEAGKELAMVLPLPVKQGADEHAVKFIDLKAYPRFFEDMENGFPHPAAAHFDEHFLRSAMPQTAAKLEVVSVGDFEASFVPTEADFSRLDERFRLPPGTWKQLPQYGDYGFAVFKLKPGKNQFHPMAFSFPRRDPQTLFFPTVHIHDGEVHKTADFDHILYCQPREGEPLKFHAKRKWEESHGHPRDFMKPNLTHGIVEPEQHCYKTVMKGDLPNQDTVVALES